MGDKKYACTALTGGGSGALDAIDGSNLSDGDVASVDVALGQSYRYTLDADSGASESSPAIISPDSNAANKRWILNGIGVGGKSIVLDADGDTSITADTDDQIDFECSGADQLVLVDGKLYPATDDDIDLGDATHEFKDAFFDGTVTTDALTCSGNITSGNDTIVGSGSDSFLLPSNAASLGGTFMTGDAGTTIAWFFLNTAPTGWKVSSAGADSVLAVVGGGDAYNVSGGTPAQGTWTQPNHIHPAGSHTHPFSSTHKLGETGGGGGGYYWCYGFQGWTASADGNHANSTDASSGNTDGGATANTWRPKASVGRLFTLDVA